MDCCKINDFDEAQQKLKDLIKHIKANKLIAKEQYVTDLITDLTGQAFEAISKKEYFDKWGKHYLPSLIFAHLHQYNNNFKDPGIQHYGGELFNALRDKAKDKKSVNMSYYMNKGGGCFAGKCMVQMDDDSV